MPATQRGQAYRLGPNKWGLRYYALAGTRKRKSPFPSKSAALAYYRAPDPGPLRRTPPQRTLYLHGEDDGCIDVRLVRDAEAHLAPGSRLDVLPGVGHFLHAEDPSGVSARVLEWVT